MEPSIWWGRWNGDPCSTAIACAQEEQLPAFLRDFGPNSAENLGFFLQRKVCLCQWLYQWDDMGYWSLQILICCMLDYISQISYSSYNLIYFRLNTSSSPRLIGARAVWWWLCTLQDHRLDSALPRASPASSSGSDKVRQYNQVLNRINEHLQQFLSLPEPRFLECWAAGGTAGKVLRW